MTGTEWIAALRRRTGQNSTTLTDAEGLILANETKNDFAERISEKNPQYFVVPSTTDLVASSTTDLTLREYPWPTDILSRMVLLEVAFATATPLKFKPVKPYPGGIERISDAIGGLTEANIIANFSNDDANQCERGPGSGCGAYYYLTRRGIYLLTGTLTAVTAAFKLWFKAYIADLANLSGSTGLHIDPTTTTFGMPFQFHNLWVDWAVIKWKTERPKPIALNAWDLDFNNRMAIALESIAYDDHRKEDFGSTPIYGDYGYEY